MSHIGILLTYNQRHHTRKRSIYQHQTVNIEIFKRINYDYEEKL